MPPIRIMEADNDFDVILTLTDPVTGLPVTGLTVTAFVSATKKQTTAAAIHADLTPTMAETPALSGIYKGVVQGSAILARLCNAAPSYTNQRVYVMRKVGTDYHKPIICRVRDGSVY